MGSVCSREQPNIGAQGLVTTHSLKTTVLQYSEQFHLELCAHLSDLVEKQCTSICLLKFFQFFSICTRKSSFSCPKSSDSISDGGMAPQLSTTISLSLQGERSWIHCASMLFPVPDEPFKNTDAKESATCDASADNVRDDR